MNKVLLVSVTNPVDLLNDPLRKLTPEELIVYTARVSNPNGQSKVETSEKLIGYLLEHKHFSPFEMVDLTVQIKTSRAIAQQILRHRSFSFQEFSLRYSEALDFVKYNARRQDTKNRQNSFDDLDADARAWFEERQMEIWDKCLGVYKEAIDKEIAKECARFLLPLNTETTIYMKGSIRSWIHYFLVRCEKSTQKEHRDIANDIFAIFKELFPWSAKYVLRELEKSNG